VRAARNSVLDHRRLRRQDAVPRSRRVAVRRSPLRRGVDHRNRLVRLDEGHHNRQGAVRRQDPQAADRQIHRRPVAVRQTHRRAVEVRRVRDPLARALR
jgi:hypothetical protein